MEQQNFKNILCIRPDTMGDILMLTPALRALKETYGAHITLLTSKSGSAITSFISEIDETIAADLPWEKNSEGFKTGKSIRTLVKKIRTKKFDVAFIFTSFSQDPFPSALIALMADIPIRIAYSHNNPYHLLTQWTPDPEPQKHIRHEVQRQLDLVGHIGAKTKNSHLSLTVPTKSVKSLVEKLLKNGISPDEPLIIMHTTASSQKRIYSKKGFVKAAKKILQKTQYQIIFTGVESEKKYIKSIQEEVGNRSYSLAGKLTLPEMITLIDLAKLLISNNTGPVHIASAVGTPVVDVYARTNPQHTPWNVSSSVLYFDVPKEYQNTVVCDIVPIDGKPLHGFEDIVKESLVLLEKDQKKINTVRLYEKNYSSHSNI